MNDDFRDRNTDRPPPNEVETGTHHEIPAEPLSAIEGAPAWAREFFARLDARLEPIAGVRQVVDQLRGSLDMAVGEMRRQNNARKAEIREVDGRVDGHDTDISEIREALADLRAERVEDRKRIDQLEKKDDARAKRIAELEAELDRWAALGGPPS